jgi:hypothetical protein
MKLLTILDKLIIKFKLISAAQLLATRELILRLYSKIIWEDIHLLNLFGNDLFVQYQLIDNIALFILPL